jgi:type I restriction enzyme S subunit
MTFMRAQNERVKAGAIFQNLTTDQVKGFITPLPPLALQREFAARVAEVRALQPQQARNRQRPNDLFQALLHRAFNGQL